MTKKSRSRYHAQPHPRGFDYVLLTVVVILVLFGMLMVYDASVVEAFRVFSDKFYFARLQAQWAVVGIIGLGLASVIPLKLVKRGALPFLLLSLVLLVAVAIPGLGQEVQGARRWLNVGGVTIQPSELVKLSVVIYLSHWLSKPRSASHFLMLVGLIVLLVMAQPDLGTSVVVTATAMGMYFLSGAPVGTLVLLGVAGAAAGFLLIFTSAYRKQRLLTFLDPSSDPLGASYHIRQILIALGSGGLLGVGIGRSRQKFEYLPEATTDSIFAVMAEEIGFVGGAILIGLFVLLVLRGFRIARAARNPFSQLLAGGITLWIGVQAFLNIATMVALVPLTGVPLPFISYGGSSLITLLTGVGLLLNVSRGKE